MDEYQERLQLYRSLKRKVDEHAALKVAGDRKQYYRHFRQQRIYAGLIGRIPGIWSILVSETFRKYAAVLAANVTRQNALFARLKLRR